METQKISELTTAGLCWVQQVKEALGGGQEAPKKHDIPEGWHLLTRHLWKDPHQPEQQFHIGINSLGTGPALHPSCALPWGVGRFFLDMQPPDTISPIPGGQPRPAAPFSHFWEAEVGAAEAQCHTASEPSMSSCLTGLPHCRAGCLTLQGSENAILREEEGWR